MADLSNIQNTPMAGSADSAGPVPDDALKLESFTPQETARLLAARQRHQLGDLNEWTEDYKRLRFARWLYEHGQIDG